MAQIPASWGKSRKGELIQLNSGPFDEFYQVCSRLRKRAGGIEPDPDSRLLGDTEMGKESLVATLREAGYPIQRIVRMGDNDGWRLTLANGAVLHCFDDGRRIVNGPGAAALRHILRSQMQGGRASSAGTQPAFHLF